MTGTELLVAGLVSGVVLGVVQLALAYITRGGR